MEASADLTGIAVVALAALLCGMAVARLRQPAIVGYILAGILLGPSALGVVSGREQIGTLAELGVLLLLFLVGMELSVRAFLVTWRLAVTAVSLQIGISVGVMLLASWAFDFSTSLAILLGFFVALSSTAVAIKMLEEIGQLRTRIGRVTVSILIAQDLAFLPMLLIVDFMGIGGFGFWDVIKFLASIGLLAALMAILNRRRKINLPFARIFAGHADLSPLTGLVYCFGAGAIFGVLGLSAAYGAFIAGLIIGNSAQRKVMLGVVQPVQSILVMVFFLSIGLLIDLRFIADNLGTVLLLLLMVTLFKTAMNVAIMRSLGESWQRAFLDGVIISQIGEFSFLLAASGLAWGAIGEDGAKLAVAVTVLSLTLSPIWLTTARRVEGMAAGRISTLTELLRLTYLRERAFIRLGSGWMRRRLARGGAAKAEAPRAEAPATDAPSTKDTDADASAPVEAPEQAPKPAPADPSPSAVAEPGKEPTAAPAEDAPEQPPARDEPAKPGAANTQIESLGRLVRAVADQRAKTADAADTKEPDRKDETGDGDAADPPRQARRPRCLTLAWKTKPAAWSPASTRPGGDRGPDRWSRPPWCSTARRFPPRSPRGSTTPRR